MTAPRLTNKVLDGLTSIAAFVEAGSSQDILGYEEDSPSLDKEAWRNILAACDWIWKVQRSRGASK